MSRRSSTTFLSYWHMRSPLADSSSGRWRSTGAGVRMTPPTWSEISAWTPSNSAASFQTSRKPGAGAAVRRESGSAKNGARLAMPRASSGGTPKARAVS